MNDQGNAEFLARKHFDKAFGKSSLETVRQRPPKGWIRAIRDALGLTARQLAARMGRAHSTLVRLERSEVHDAITLASLKAAAAAMECTLVYALIPNRPLADIARHRAALIADAQLARMHHTMQLENQALRKDHLAEERERLIAEILARGGRRLWEEP
ncbi:MAG: mobile mystery protein A [Parvularculaceae bacterium]